MKQKNWLVYSIIFLFLGVGLSVPTKAQTTGNESGERGNVEKLRDLYAKRDFQSCAETGQNPSAKMPENVEAEAWTISCRARIAEQKADALKAAQDLTAERGANGWSWFALANVQLATQKNKEAQDSIEKSLAIEPDTEEFIFTKAQSLSAQKKYDEAGNYLEQNSAKIKDKSRLAYLEAIILYNRSKISADKTDEALKKQSLDKFAEAVKLAPRSVNANYLYGAYLNDDKRYAESYPLLKTAIALSPNVFEIRQKFWKLIENQANKTEAQKNIELLADMDSFIKIPSITPKTLQAVTFELGRRKLDGKKTEYENILLQRFPQSREAERTAFFRIFEFQNKNKEKKNEFTKMMWDFINRPTHLDDSLLSTAYFHLYLQAKEDKSVSDAQFLKIVEGRVKYGKKNLYGAYLDSALALVERNMLADAARIVKDSFAANEKYIDIQSSPEKPKSRQAALDEANSYSHSTLGYIYFKMGKLKDAEDELTQAVRLNDKSAITFYRLGQVYEAQKDFNKAEENYAKGFLASSWDENPNTNAIKELYKKQNGNLDGFDAYFDKYRKQESILRKARILAERNTDAKNAAPFTLKTIDDKTISFTDLKGKIVVINIWGTWCAPCVAEMPQLQQLYKKYENDKDVAIITMDTNDELEAVKKFIAGKKYEFPVLQGDSYTSNIMFDGNIAFPTTLFVDQQGKIAFTKTGSEPKVMLFEK